MQALEVVACVAAGAMIVSGTANAEETIGKAREVANTCCSSLSISYWKADARTAESFVDGAAPDGMRRGANRSAL